MNPCLAVLPLLVPLASPGDVTAMQLGAPPAAITSAHKLWSFNVGTSTPGLALGDRGEQVVLIPYSGGLTLLSSSDVPIPVPIWESLDANNVGAARGADATDAYLASRFDIVGHTTSEGTLMLFRSSSPAPVWSFGFEQQLFSTPLYDLSRDGQVVVSLFDSDGSLEHQLRVHDPTTGAPTALFTYPIDTYAARFDLSPDGTTAAHSAYDGLGSATLVDVATGAVVLTTPGSIPSEQALSDGGEVVITREKQAGIGWNVRVQSRATGSWETRVLVSTDLSEYPQDLALSDDGAVAVATWHDDDLPLDVTLRAYEVATGALLLERTLGGAVGLENYVGDVAVSADGARIALGTWGNGGSGPSELVVYDTWADTTLASFPAGGSVFDVELSADGRRLLDHRIGNHATQGHIQTFVELHDLGGADLFVVGAPRVGAAVEFHVLGPAGHSALLLLAAGLLPTPLPVGAGGDLLLDPGTLLIVDFGPTDGGGESWRALPIPPLPVLVGQVVFAQGATTGPKALGRSWIGITLLP